MPPSSTHEFSSTQRVARRSAPDRIFSRFPSISLCAHAKAASGPSCIPHLRPQAPSPMRLVTPDRHVSSPSIEVFPFFSIFTFLSMAVDGCVLTMSLPPPTTNRIPPLLRPFVSFFLGAGGRRFTHLPLSILSTSSQPGCRPSLPPFFAPESRGRPLLAGSSFRANLCTR